MGRATERRRGPHRRGGIAWLVAALSALLLLGTACGTPTPPTIQGLAGTTATPPPATPAPFPSPATTPAATPSADYTLAVMPDRGTSAIQYHGAVPLDAVRSAPLTVQFLPAATDKPVGTRAAPLYTGPIWASTWRVRPDAAGHFADVVKLPHVLQAAGSDRLWLVEPGVHTVVLLAGSRQVATAHFTVLAPSPPPSPPPGPPPVGLAGAWFASADQGWAIGQRCQAPPIPTPDPYGNLATPPPPTCQGVVEHTADGGRSWTPQSLGDPRLIPQAIQFVDATHGWLTATTSAGCGAGPCATVLYATTDGGAHWEAQFHTGPNTPSIMADGRPTMARSTALTTLAVTAPHAVWAFGTACTGAGQSSCRPVLFASAGRGSFSQVAFPAQQPVYRASLAHPTAADGWIVTSGGDPPTSRIVATHNGGATWHDVPDPAPGDSWQQLDFRSATEGWLLSGSEPGAGQQLKTLYHTTNGGQTWRRVASAAIGAQQAALPSSGYVGPLVFPTAADGWIASPRGGLLHSADGGKTWTPITTVSCGDLSCEAVEFSGASVGWVVSPHGLWLTNDAGRAWEELTVSGVDSAQLQQEEGAMPRLHRWLWLLVVVLLAGCGSATPLASAPSPSPAATVATLAVTPSPTTPPATPVAPTATPSGAWLALSPTSGPPGTTVRLTGYLPGGPPTGAAADHGDVCWDGCPTGLVEDAAVFTWSSAHPGRFQTTFTVPDAPWLAADGVHPLVPGAYAIGLPCLTQPQPVKKGPGFVPCSQQPARLAAIFHLTGPTTNRCGADPCTELQLDPPAGPPGTLVHVHGWAPLNNPLIGGQPADFELAIQPNTPDGPPWLGAVQQASNGDLSGTFRLPLAIGGLGDLAPGRYTLALQSIPQGTPVAAGSVPGGVSVTPLIGKGGGTYGYRLTLAPASFTVTAAPTWASLGAITPVRTQWSAEIYTGMTVVGDPADPQRLADCAPDAIHVSTDAGASWQSIPTAGVRQAVAATPFQLFNQSVSPPACIDLVLDPAHPHSLYATFPVVPKAQPSPPPVNRIGLVTTDDGQTWQAVPTPPGDGLAAFRGFQAAGRAVVALFGGQATPAGPGTFAAEETTDGGRSWQPGQLPCPAPGPCVRWGPAPAAIGGMGAGYPQPIEVSGDGGRSWTTPAWPDQVYLNQGPSQLVALPPTEVALVDGTGPYPLLVSRDGGQTWQVIVLPAVPHPSATTVPFYNGLQLLPNGALVTPDSQGRGWVLLPPGAHAWCPLPALSAPIGSATPRVVGDRLWWLVPSTSGGGAMVPRSVPLSALRCGSG